MKKILLLMMAVAMVAISSSATKIYVCGTKITGTTSFSAGGGTVSYDDDTRLLTITNVNYTKSGSSNNGISVDEVSGSLYIVFYGDNSFTIADADAVLCKSGKPTFIVIKSGATAFFISNSSGHAGLKLQDGDVSLSGIGSLTIKNGNSSTSARAIKGGSKTERLNFYGRYCVVQSNGERLYNLKAVNFYESGSTSSNENDYNKVVFKSPQNGTLHASNVTTIYNESYYRILRPVEYYGNTPNNYLNGSTLANSDVVVSDYRPALIINSSNFPDANFRNYLLSLYPVGYLNSGQLLNCTSLNVPSKNIYDLTGVHRFTYLTQLICPDNYISTLPSLPSGLTYLDCRDNSLFSISSLPSGLRSFLCDDNFISSLPTSVLPSSLVYLSCKNNKLTSLDFNGTSYSTNLPNLYKLDCSYNTQLTQIKSESGVLETLVVSGCTSLKTISCSFNKISSLSSLPSSLKNLYIHSNQLTSLPTLPSGLEYLSVASNKLTSFVYYNNSSIKYINIGNNPIAATEVCNNSNLTNFYVYSTPSLKILTCYGNSSLKSLDLDDCTGLLTLNCYNNSSLEYFSNLGDCTQLTKIDCYNNKLTSLDVSNLSNLIELICRQNKLTSLDVSNKTKLTKLYAYMNQLTSLNVQGCTALNDLDVGFNKLTSLSVQGCNALRSLNCAVNQINASGANTLINSLCTIPAGSQGALKYLHPDYVTYNYTESNVALTAAQNNTARNKRWIPMKYVSGSWVEIPVSGSIPGDVNGDGYVTSADVTAIYDVMLGTDMTFQSTADVNGDGYVTSADVTAVYDILLGN